MMRLALDHDLGVLARDAVVEQPDLRLLAAADDRLLALDLVHLADAGAGQDHQVGAVALDLPAGATGASNIWVLFVGGHP